MSFNSNRSANSADRSKRSHNSAASNPSGTGRAKTAGSDSKNKRQKPTNQKTLGMAWGSNSRSSSRSSFRSAPFSDFGSYMEVKNRKLHHQFDAEASSSSTIFSGVSIFVDGFTVPSSQELRAYMSKHGGRFENYFSRHHVTHIICSNLPDSKVKNLRSFSGGLPVVKPKWIVDCITANKLLSWVPYELNQVADNQPKLSAFFNLKSDSMPDVDFKATVCQIDDVAESSLTGRRTTDASPEVVEDTFQRGEGIDGQNADATPEKSSVDCFKEPSEKYGTDLTDLNIEEQDTSSEEHHDSPSIPSTSASNYCLSKPNVTESPTLASNRQFSKSHSTLGDPNFVENYFKHSRLHFIGTWRNRYRKRYPSISGVNSVNSNLKASESSQKSTTIHIDMDCFFVAVVIRNIPDLQDKPVAICHSDNPKGTAEISSANYPARDYGVKAGMFVRDAKALCPNLVIFPYNFEAYEEVADQFYDILHKHCKKVQAVSCDEAFLEVIDSEVGDPQLLASNIRQEVYEATKCTASAGIAGNMLMARLATRTAKPNGQCYIPSERVDEYLHQLPIKALPGIGRVLEDKLKQRNVSNCGQLRLIPKDTLQKEFGIKTGEMLWNYSRGVDNRLVGAVQESKSIGADVNWGVRFKDLKDTKQFISNLCNEVSLRLQGCGVQGRKLTLKIKKRSKNAEEPTKYMGHGVCDSFSHSVTVPAATDNVDVLFRITMQLFGHFHIDVKEIRGVGLQVSKLENSDAFKQGMERNTLKSWLTSANQEQSDLSHDKRESARIGSERQSFDGTTVHLQAESTRNMIRRESIPPRNEASLNQSLEPPPLGHLDMEVVESLPPELLAELNAAYGGKLVKLISKTNCSNDRAGEGCSSDARAMPRARASSEMEHPQLQQEEAVPITTRSHETKASESFRNNDFLPSSLSQIDPSVLQELPEELRHGILESLPETRGTDHLMSNMPQEKLTSMDDTKLWIGNPPRWIDKFKTSRILILDIISDMYLTAASPRNLSRVLQCCISKASILDAVSDDSDAAVGSLSEVLKQYVKLKIERDIEEIYVCLRLLKRLSIKSKFFLEVHKIIFPYIQLLRIMEEFYRSIRSLLVVESLREPGNHHSCEKLEEQKKFSGMSVSGRNQDVNLKNMATRLLDNQAITVSFSVECNRANPEWFNGSHHQASSFPVTLVKEIIVMQAYSGPSRRGGGHH